MAGGYAMNVYPNADCGTRDGANGSGQRGLDGLCQSISSFADLDASWGSFEVIKIDD